jgi:hypothetical protein
LAARSLVEEGRTRALVGTAERGKIVFAAPESTTTCTSVETPPKEQARATLGVDASTATLDTA